MTRNQVGSNGSVEEQIGQGDAEKYGEGDFKKVMYDNVLLKHATLYTS